PRPGRTEVPAVPAQVRVEGAVVVGSFGRDGEVERADERADVARAANVSRRGGASAGLRVVSAGELDEVAGCQGRRRRVGNAAVVVDLRVVGVGRLRRPGITQLNRPALGQLDEFGAF